MIGNPSRPPQAHAYVPDGWELGCRVNATTRRGAGGVAIIVALVIMQLMMVGSLLTGTRNQDLTVQRLNALRSQYSADSVLSMAVREVCRGADEDGDGTVGSISWGVVANGPNINGAHAAVSLSASGTTYTLTAKGTGGLATRAISVAMVAGASSVNPLTVYATSAASAVPVARTYASGAWGSAVNVNSMASTASWLILRNSPVNTATPTSALIALAQDGSLTKSIYSSGTWGPASTLTSSTGTVNTRVFAADFASSSGDLMVAYRKGSNSTLYYRTYSVASPSEQSFSIGLASAPTWMEIASKPGSNEMVLVAASGSSLRAGVWNGSSWGNSTSLESALAPSGRPFHVAYMTQSGTAMVVWTATSGAPKYATWDGSSWSSVSSVPGITGGVPAGWIKLEPSPLRSSNEILLACIGTNKQINVNNWTGSAWGSNLLVESAAADCYSPRVDVCYQPDGAKALVVWHKSGQTSLRYRTWSSGSWSSQQTGPDMTSTTNAIHLARGYNSTEVMMLARRNGGTSYSDYNSTSDDDDYDLGSVTIVGPIPNGSGSYLPTPPSATANSTNISPSGGTVAPGTYGTMSQSGTVTFTAGTYVFSSVTVDGTLIFDTSAGPISFVITAGDLSGTNNNTFTNTGNAPAQIHILDGDFSLKNNTTFTNIDIFVYDGGIELKNNTNGSVGLYASDTVEIKNNGTITLNSYHSGTASACSVVLWTNGSAGSRVDLSTSCSLAGVTDPCDLAGSPIPQSASIDSWAAVSP